MVDLNEIKFYPNILRSKHKNPSKLKLTFKLFNQTVKLDLELNRELFAPNFNIQKTYNSKFSKNVELNNLNCFYHGRLKTDLENDLDLDANDIYRSYRSSRKRENSSSIVSLSICKELRGLIQTTDYLYLINPLTEQLIRRFNLFNKIQLNQNTLFIKRTKNNDLIRKLAEQITNQPLFVKEVNNQNSTLELKRTKRFTRLDYHNPKIELACFVDESLYNYLKKTYFIRTDHQIVTFILTILNGIQTLYNQFSKYDINLKFNIVLLEILKEQPKVSRRMLLIKICFTLKTFKKIFEILLLFFLNLCSS